MDEVQRSFCDFCPRFYGLFAYAQDDQRYSSNEI